MGYLNKIVYFCTFADNSFLLTFTIPQKNLNEKDYQEVLGEYSKGYTLINVGSTVGDKGQLEVTYKLTSVSSGDRQGLLEEFSKLRGVKNISLVSSKNYIEY